MDHIENELPERSAYAGIEPEDVARQHLAWIARAKALGVIAIVVLGAVAVGALAIDSPLAVPVWIAMLVGIVFAGRAARSAIAGRNAALLGIATVDLRPDDYATVICEIDRRTRDPRAHATNLIELARAQYYMGDGPASLAILDQARELGLNRLQELEALAIEAACHGGDAPCPRGDREPDAVRERVAELAAIERQAFAKRAPDADGAGED